MKQVYLPDGSSMPQLGQGTWQMGEDDNKYEREIAGLRHGIELGMTLIDTAEMYADGKAENMQSPLQEKAFTSVTRSIRKTQIVNTSTAV